MAGESLSVIVPNFNHARFLPAALDGILRQTRRPQEIIIIDDGSTDDSWTVIDAYGRRHPELIRTICQPANSGAVATINFGVALATGSVVCVHSADDCIAPDYFEVMVGLLERHPRAGLAASRPATFHDRIEDALLNPGVWTPDEGYHAPADIALALRTRAFTTGQVLYRRAAIDRAGPLDERLHGFCDWFWIHSTIFRSGMVYTPRVISWFRLTGDGSVGAASTRDRARNAGICVAMLEKLHRPENADLLAPLAQSGVMFQLGTGLAETVLGDPRWWTPTVFALAQTNLHQWTSESLSWRTGAADIAEPLQARVERAARICATSGWRRLAVYGAGSHTRELLHVWPRAGGPAIACVIVTTPPAAREFEGLPVYGVSEPLPEPIDAIVLSSRTYERAMAEAAGSHHPGIPVLGLYERRG